MAKVMTAAEYRGRLTDSWNLLSNLIPMALTLIGALLFFFTGHPELHRHDHVILNWTLWPLLSWLILISVIRGIRDNRLRRKHPEMRYIDDWLEVMGNIKNYPIPGLNLEESAAEADAKLRDLTLAANASFAARDAIGKMIDPASEPGDAYARHLRSVHQELEQKAVYKYAACKKAWLLFVQQIDILSYGGQDLEDYRKSLLKKYLFSR